MKLIWKITLHEIKTGYQVRIDGEGGSAIGKASTPHHAYRAAEVKLIVKPWLTSNADTTKRRVLP